MEEIINAINSTGFPIVMTLLMMGLLVWYVKTEQEKTKEKDEKFNQVIAEQTKVLNEVQNVSRETNQVITQIVGVFMDYVCKMSDNEKDKEKE